MPTLPSARDLGVVQVQPSQGIVPLRGETGLEGATARGIQQLAGSADRITGHLIQAQDEFDATQAEDRFNQFQVELEKIRSDPQNGWGAASGENAFKPGFAEAYDDRFEEARKRFEDTLGSRQAKFRFNKMAQAAVLKDKAQMHRHAASEHVKWSGQVYKDSLGSIEQNIWRNFGNDESFANDLAKAREMTEAYTRKWFVGADEKSIQRATQAIESRLWRKRIEGALDSDKTEIAQDLFKKATGSLVTDDQAAISKRLQAGVRISKAVKAVDDVFAKFVSKDLNAPYPADQIDEALRKRFETDPTGLQSARQEAAHRAQALQIAQRENGKANVGAVMSMFYEKRMPLSSIMKSQEYQALEGDQKARFVTGAETYMHVQEGRRATAEGRALTAMQREALQQERTGEQAFLAYRLNPDAVVAMDDAAIADFSLSAGLKAANRLKDLRDSLQKSADKLVKARMDVQQFKGIIGEYGYKPELLNVRPKNDKQREEQESLRTMYNNINERIQARAQDLKRDLSPTEKDEIMRDALKDKIQIDYGWKPGEFFSRDVEKPAISVPRTGERAEEFRSRGEIPIEQIPQAEMSVYLAGLKKLRPSLKGADDRLLLSKYRKVLQRAYALQTMGASADEVKDVLSGATQ